VRPKGFYIEYVVPTPGVNGPGSQRLVVGADGSVYYTGDHYRNFTQIGEGISRTHPQGLGLAANTAAYLK